MSFLQSIFEWKELQSIIKMTFRLVILFLKYDQDRSFFLLPCSHYLLGNFFQKWLQKKWPSKWPSEGSFYFGNDLLIVQRINPQNDLQNDHQNDLYTVILIWTIWRSFFFQSDLWTVHEYKMTFMKVVFCFCFWPYRRSFRG